jgi:hypothetical protein
VKKEEEEKKEVKKEEEKKEIKKEEEKKVGTIPEYLKNVKKDEKKQMFNQNIKKGLIYLKI